MSKSIRSCTIHDELHTCRWRADAESSTPTHPPCLITVTLALTMYLNISLTSWPQTYLLSVENPTWFLLK